MAGLTDKGMEIKRLGDVITDLRIQAQSIFQDLVPPGDVVDTGPSSTIGRLIGLQSPSIADLWEVAMQLWWAFDPNAASGVALDNLVMYAGLTRGVPTATTAQVEVWGNQNTVLSFDEQVRSTDNNLFSVATPVTLDRARCTGAEFQFVNVNVVGTTFGFDITSGSTTAVLRTISVASDTATTIAERLAAQLAPYPWLTATIQSNGTIRVVTTDYLDFVSISAANANTVINKIRTRTLFRNDVVGEIPQDANTLNSIATPILGWDSANNPQNATLGKDTETDEELRVRFRDSKYFRASNITDSLYSALMQIDGILASGIFENDTDSYDPVYDLPPHSFRVVALGGGPSDIATAIWKNKPLGIRAMGNTTENITDSQGFIRTIAFDRPVDTRVYIKMELKVNSEVFPADGVEAIRANITQYFQDNFSIGQEVIYSRLYTPINQVPGHQVNSLTIGTTPNPTGTSNIVVPYNGVASIRSSDILISVV